MKCTIKGIRWRQGMSIFSGEKLKGIFFKAKERGERKKGVFVTIRLFFERSYHIKKGFSAVTYFLALVV